MLCLTRSNPSHGSPCSATRAGTSRMVNAGGSSARGSTELRQDLPRHDVRNRVLRVLLVEAALPGSGRAADQRKRPIHEPGQDGLLDGQVVLDQPPLGHPLSFPQHLVRTADPHSGDLQLPFPLLDPRGHPLPFIVVRTGQWLAPPARVAGGGPAIRRPRRATAQDRVHSATGSDRPHPAAPGQHPVASVMGNGTCHPVVIHGRAGNRPDSLTGTVARVANSRT